MKKHISKVSGWQSVVLFGAVMFVAGSVQAKVTQAPAHLQYFGYYASAMDGVGTGNYIQETSNHANLAWIKGTVKAKLKETQGRGMKAVVDVQDVFFDSRLNLLPDYKQSWQKFVVKIAPFVDSIAAFYPLDEPYLNAANVKVSATTIKDRLEKVIATMKATYPQIPAAVIFSTTDISAQGVMIPKGYDWVSFDCYGSWNNCSGHSIPWYLSALEKSMNKNQRAFLVPDGTIKGTKVKAIQQQWLADMADQYYNLAAQDPKVIGLVPFIYQTFKNEKGKVFTGTRDMPKVLEKFTSIGRKISN